MSIKMISPETFIETYENKSYDQLLVIRQLLLNGIYAFETAKPNDNPKAIYRFGQQKRLRIKAI